MKIVNTLGYHFSTTLIYTNMLLCSRHSSARHASLIWKSVLIYFYCYQLSFILDCISCGQCNAKILDCHKFEHNYCANDRSFKLRPGYSGMVVRLKCRVLCNGCHSSFCSRSAFNEMPNDKCRICIGFDVNSDPQNHIDRLARIRAHNLAPSDLFQSILNLN